LILFILVLLILFLILLLLLLLLLLFLLFFEGFLEIIAGFGVARVELEGIFPGVDALLQFLLLDHGHAFVIIAFFLHSFVRTVLYGGVIVVRGLVELIVLELCVTQVVVGGGAVGRLLDGPLVLLYRFVEFAFFIGPVAATHLAIAVLGSGGEGGDQEGQGQEGGGSYGACTGSCGGGAAGSCARCRAFAFFAGGGATFREEIVENQQHQGDTQEPLEIADIVDELGVRHRFLVDAVDLLRHGDQGIVDIVQPDILTVGRSGELLQLGFIEFGDHRIPLLVFFEFARGRVYNGRAIGRADADG